jgi:hypothetical protein
MPARRVIISARTAGDAGPTPDHIMLHLRAIRRRHPARTGRRQEDLPRPEGRRPLKAGRHRPRRRTRKRPRAFAPGKS